jgi:HEAT repeat protein
VSAQQISGLEERRRRAAVAGHSGDLDEALRAIVDPHPSVRSLGYGALLRLGALSASLATEGLNDPDTLVVRRVIECVARQPASPEIDQVLLRLLADAPDVVAEVSAWALGERHQASDETADETTETDADFRAETKFTGTQIVSALSTAATSHDDALVRESAAAALGAIGHSDGLTAVLHATSDKATVRRRAVLALAAFEGPEVTAALERARMDRDWQVRQAAEDLLKEQ